MIRWLHTWMQKRTKTDKECSKQHSKKRRTTTSIKNLKSKDRKLRILRPKLSSDPLKNLMVELGKLQSEFENLKMEQEDWTK